MRVPRSAVVTGILIALAAIIPVDRPGAEPLVESLRELPRAKPDTLDHMAVSEARSRAFAATLEAVIAGKMQMANETAASAGYRILPLAEDGHPMILLRENSERSVGPAVVISRKPDRDVILEAPHAIKDRGTGDQAAVLLLRLGGRAAIISGANRCAALSVSPCSGRTRVCGDGRRPYRSSDSAHNPNTLFHVAHRVLSQAWPKAIVLSLHGFSGRGSPTLFVLSDGTRENRTGDPTVTGRLRDAIRLRLDDPASAVSCQDPADKKYDYRPLCARTNVQGRDLNGSQDVCGSDAIGSSGRFIHAEQQWRVRRPVVRDWRSADQDPRFNAITEALEEVLPCIKVNCSK